ncbi:MAG: heme o synthase [Candidatus Sumerlaeia bacterium]
MPAAIHTRISGRIERLRDCGASPWPSAAVRVRPCVSRHDWLWAALPPALTAAVLWFPDFEIRPGFAVAVNLIIFLAAMSCRAIRGPRPGPAFAPSESARSPVSSRLSALLALTKPFLTLLVLGTTLAGYCLGSGGRPNAAACVVTLVGTALVAAGALAINEHDERDLDARLSRTARRPIPAGRIAPATALRFGIALWLAGLVALLAAGPVPALLAVDAAAIYLFLYTPLKRITPLATLVGAVAGALPPLIGWSAAAPLAPPAWRLFLIVFLWQIPHFLAIGWRWRDDYAAAGVPVYCALDGAGRATGLHMLNYSAAVAAVTFMGAPGGLYPAATAVLGAFLILPCIAFALRPTGRAARRVFVATVMDMPLLLALMAAG